MIAPIQRPTLYEAVGGGEETHFNPVCADEIDRIVGPVVGAEVDDVQREVPCAGRRLDLLATAGTRRVAIELQYGAADPSHLGRLVGWYAPNVAATDMILIAESFPKALVEAVREDRIPDLALMRAVTGWNPDGQPGLDFEIVFSNITPMPTGSLSRSETDAAMHASVAVLADALNAHGLKDSNAQGYVRLFPVREGFWATAYVRSGRVVIGISGRPVFDAEAAEQGLGDGWGVDGNGIWNTVSDDVESYVLSADDAVKVAGRIAGMVDEINHVVDSCIAHVVPEADTEEYHQ